MSDREETSQLTLDFSKLFTVARGGEAVIPVVVQNMHSLAVLIVGYTNETALKESIRLGRVVLWSTSRQCLWDKGATSGDVLSLNEIRVNCEQNSVLYMVTPLGDGVCHSKDAIGKTRSTCFYRRFDGQSLQFLD